jgi:hypothetical protein
MSYTVETEASFAALSEWSTALSERSTDDLLQRMSDLLSGSREKLAAGELQAAENLMMNYYLTFFAMMVIPKDARARPLDDAQRERLDALVDASDVLFDDASRASGNDSNYIRALTRQQHRPKLVK